MMKRVGITMRVVNASGYEEARDAIGHDWIRLFTRLEYVPVLVPNLLGRPAEYLERLGVEALILSGGNDVHVRGEGSDSPPAGAPAERDRTERLLVDYAVEKRMPVFGVCRGMQFLNVYFHGRIRRIESISKEAVDRHVATTHTVRIRQGRYADLMAESAEVNSFHEYGVRPEDVSSQLRIFATEGRDGLCEGLYHPDLPILAVQWHPERDHPGQAEDERLISAFLEERA